MDLLSEPIQDLLDIMLEEVTPFCFRDADDTSPHEAIEAAWRDFLRPTPGTAADENRFVEGWMARWRDLRTAPPEQAPGSFRAEPLPERNTSIRVQ